MREFDTEGEGLDRLKRVIGRASLEAIAERGDLGLPVLHPGGLEGTRDLVRLCHISSGKRLLDVASGTGGSVCCLAHEFGCKVTGIDHSAYMAETAKRKTEERGLGIEFKRGDAHDLPFDAETFDVVISECATCALDKQKAIGEMVRIVRRGGYVGISDLYWREGASERLKSKLVELENDTNWRVEVKVRGCGSRASTSKHPILKRSSASPMLLGAFGIVYLVVFEQLSRRADCLS